LIQKGNMSFANAPSPGSIGTSQGAAVIFAILYARVSSREQEREGYSIPAQRKMLAEYARSHGFEIVREFIDIESAKNPGRKEFGNMLRLLEADGSIRIVLVEKTDRLYRNRADALSFEELIEKRGVEVHLVKEARVIEKESRSQDKFMHDIHVAVAKHYVENLRDEVKKGMREKAEQGIYPGRAPYGYRNNRLTRSIDIDESKAPIIKRAFELYATGRESLTTLRKTILENHGLRVSRAYLETILKNPFYIGQFVWRGVIYDGTHAPLISLDLFQRVQDTFAGRNKPKYRKHEFAFAGLLSCAHDGCTVTTELQKGRYIYYRCSHGRGKCALPYMREEDVANRLGQLLKDIYVPEGIAARIVGSLNADLDRSERERKANLAALDQRLEAIRTRMNQIYEDKLDGKVSAEFWNRKQAEYRDHERAVQVEIARASGPVTRQHTLTAKRIFELATSAYSLYLTRNSAEQGQLLKSVLLNCATDGVSLWPVYRKPFDLIFERAKSEDWSGRADLNRGPPAPKAGALPGCATPRLSFDCPFCLLLLILRDSIINHALRVTSVALLKGGLLLAGALRL
jgi:site-specific DNA recombinase